MTTFTTRRRTALRLSSLSLAALAALHTLPASGQTATWTGGTGSWLDATRWSGLAVPNSTLAAVAIDGGLAGASWVDMAWWVGATVGTLAIDAGDTLQMSGYLTVAGGRISNHGTLALAGSGAGWATLYLAADTTLAGNGVTVLSRGPLNYTGFIKGGNHTLTIASGHTVHGVGQIGYDDLNVDNQGTVSASMAGDLLQLSPGRGKTFNNEAGIVAIADGAKLKLTSGTLSGGTVRGGTTTAGVLEGAGLVTGATLTGLLQLSGSNTFRNVALTGQFQLSGADTFQDLALTGNATVRGGTLYTRGTITNTGSLELVGSSSGSAALTLTADTTLAGNGNTVQSLSPTGNYGYISGADHTLTIGSGHTLSGAGAVGYADLNVVNQGTVSASVAGKVLRLNPGSGKTFDNAAGLVTIADGATLSLVSGTLIGGAVRGGSAAAGVLDGAGVVAGTTLSGLLQLTGRNTFEDVTLTGTTALLGGGSLIRTRGTLTNTGTLEIAGNSGAAGLALVSDTTLAGNGSTVLSRNAGSVGSISGAGHTLTIGAGHTVRGNGAIGDGSLNTVNMGTVSATVAGDELTLYPGSGYTFNNAAGLVIIADGATLNLVNGTFSGGKVQGSSAAAGHLGGNGVFRDLTLAGQVAPITGRLNVAGTIANTGTLTLTGLSTYAMLTLAADTTLAGTGTTVLSRSTSGSDGFIAGAGHTLTIGAGQTVRGVGTIGLFDLAIINQGTVVAEGSSPLNFRTTSFDNTTGTLEVAADGLLSSIGAITLGDASQLVFDLAGGHAQHGKLQLRSGTRFDGTLTLNFSGYTAQVGDSFTLIDFTGTAGGSFDAVQAAGYTLQAHYNLNDVTVTVTGVSAVPEPQTWALWLLGAAGLRARRPGQAKAKP